jgi:ABC-type glycerol-3-phosphate transport system substrate-binding protein
MPAGPLGTRHVGLYTPPYALPSRSESKEAAWELAKFLCAPEQVLDDVHRSGFVEVARESVLNDAGFQARFRPELLSTVAETRPVARGERPITNYGMEVGNLIGDEVVRVLTGELSAPEAMANAERTVAALGAPWAGVTR